MPSADIKNPRAWNRMVALHIGLEIDAQDE
jgi:hypothetical protein